MRRAAQGAFRRPLVFYTNENPVCNISKTSVMQDVIRQGDLILFEECTMMHKRTLSYSSNVKICKSHCSFIRFLEETSGYIKRKKIWWDSIMFKIFQTLATGQNHKTKTNIKAVLSNERISKELPIKLLFLGEWRVPVENEVCIILSSVRIPGAIWQRINDKSLPEHQRTLSESQVIKEWRNLSPQNYYCDLH